MNAPELRAREGPRGLEWWLAYAALLAVVILPALAKLDPENPSASSPLTEGIWTIFYVLAALRLFADRQRSAGLFRSTIVLWPLLLIMVLSVLWSVNPYITFKNSIELVGTSLIAYYFVLRYPLARLLDLFGFAFGSIAIISLAFVFLSPGRGRMYYGSGEWSGVFQDKNNLGTAMVLAIITLSVTLFSGSRLKIAVRMFTLAICLVLLAGAHSATATSAGLLALLVGLGAWVWRSPRFGPSGRFIMAVGGTFLALGIFLFGFQQDALLSVLGRSSTLTGRTDFWPYLQQAIHDRPILGYGYNAFFQSASGDDYLSYYVVQAGGWTPYHAHDSFLQIGLDAGYAGLACLAVLLLSALAGGLRYLRSERGVIAAWPLMIVLFTIFGSYTETYIGNYNTLEWIFFVAAVLYPKRQVEAAPEPVRERMPLAVSA